MIEVVAGLIKVNDKYLIAKRSMGKTTASLKWEFPGGKVNPGEDEEMALKRELMEELSINVDVGKYLCEYTKVFPERNIHIKLYECNYIDGDIFINHEHTDYKIVDFEDIKNFDLVDADRKLYEQVSNMI